MFISALSLLNKKTGYLFSVADMSLYKTTDMGSSWERNDIKTIIGGYEPFIDTQGSLIYSMRFTNENCGILAMPFKNDDGLAVYVLRTENGGGKWNVEKTPLTGLKTLFISRDLKYITAYNITSKTIEIISCNK